MTQEGSDIDIIFSPVDTISDFIKTWIGSPDLISVQDKGDYIEKKYVYRVLKFMSNERIKTAIKYLEALEPPLRDPRRIKVESIKTLEEGKYTKDVLVTVLVPKYGIFSRRIKSIKDEIEKLKKEFEHEIRR